MKLLQIIAAIACVLLFSITAFAEDVSSCETLRIERTENGQVIVPIDIHGKRLRVILEGGSHTLSLDGHALEDSGAKRTSKTIKMSGIVGEATEHPIYLLQEMRIGNVSIRDVEVIEDFEWGVSSKGVGVETMRPDDGVFGILNLKSRAVLLDIRHQRMAIGSSAACRSQIKSENIVLPLILDEEGISVLLRLDNKTVRMNVDLGSTISAVKPKSVPKGMSLAACTMPMPEGWKCELYIAQRATTQHGEKSTELLTPNLYAIPLDQLSADGLLGTDYLEHFSLIFDFKNSELVLIPHVRE